MKKRKTMSILYIHNSVPKMLPRRDVFNIDLLMAIHMDGQEMSALKQRGKHLENEKILYGKWIYKFITYLKKIKGNGIFISPIEQWTLLTCTHNFNYLRPSMVQREIKTWEDSEEIH